MRARLFQNPVLKSRINMTYQLRWDIADMLLLSIFGFGAMRHIVRDCEQRRLMQKDMEQAVKIREEIEKTAMDGCKKAT